LRPIKVVEEEIAYTEMKIEEIGEEMNNPEIYTEHEVVNQLNAELNGLNQTLETLYEEWEEIMESIEAS
jgi:ATP-binding cassette subfamily F protein 3